MAVRGSTAAHDALTEQDVTALREELSAGGPVTVWFTKAAVGVPAGGSAKFVAVGDVAEGDFIQVRPAGSRDAVFCSPTELTRSRPARRSATSASRTVTAADDTTATPAAPSRPVRARRPAPSTTPAESSTAAPDLPVPAPEKPTPEKAAPKVAPARPRKRAERSGPLTVSLTSTAEGDWAVEVLVGAKRVVASTPIQAADVATVSRSLPPAVAEVVTSALAEARRRQEERVAQLREELDAAQRTLEQLGVD